MTGFKQNLKESWSSLLTFINAWAHTPHHNQINTLIFLQAKPKLMNKGLPASSGVHGLRVGFSEVGPEVVIILTLGLDDLLLFLLSWNDKIKQNDKLTEDFLTSSLKRKKKLKKSEPIIL